MLRFNKSIWLSGMLLILSLLSLSCSSRPNPKDYIPKQAPAAEKIGPVNVALVLGGGGSRGVAHAGVIEVLEQHGIPIDLIVGTSAGGLIGALYADDPNAQRLRQKVINLKRKDLIDPSMLSSIKMLWELNGPSTGEAMKNTLLKNLSATHFKELKIPLVVVTTDVDVGETYTIQSGPLLPALQASAALPMVFKPVLLYGKKLVDGGVSSPLPVEVAKRYHPEVIIAIDIGTSPNYGPVNSVYALGYRSLHISYYYLSKWQGEQADILIHPQIDKYSMFDDAYNQEMYDAGRQAALSALPQIKAKIARIKHG